MGIKSSHMPIVRFTFGKHNYICSKEAATCISISALSWLWLDVVGKIWVWSRFAESAMLETWNCVLPALTCRRRPGRRAPRPFRPLGGAIAGRGRPGLSCMLSTPAILHIVTSVYTCRMRFSLICMRKCIWCMPIMFCLPHLMESGTWCEQKNIDPQGQHCM